MKTSPGTLPRLRRTTLLMFAAAMLALAVTQPAAAAEAPGSDATTVVPLPSQIPTLKDDVLDDEDLLEDGATGEDELLDLEKKDPLPSGHVDPTRPLDEIIGDEPDGGSTGTGGSGGSGDAGDAADSGGSGSTGDAESGSSGTHRPAETPGAAEDATPGGEVGIRLAPPKTYTSVIGDGALATAERALRLARPLAPPLLLAAFALTLLLSIARGNDRLIRIEPTPEKRTYRL